jgi:hypothetical protein
VNRAAALPKAASTKTWGPPPLGIHIASLANKRAKHMAPAPEIAQPQRLNGPMAAKLEGSKKTPEPTWLPTTRATTGKNVSFFFIACTVEDTRKRANLGTAF